jgi:transcriptional regulator with XRE-family HTH domain
MSNVSTNKSKGADLGTAHVRRRGSNALKRLELPLAGIRKAAGKTQVQVAEVTGMGQGDVARLESQEDMRLSTLKRYAEALGARLDVAFEYPNGARVYLARAPEPVIAAGEVPRRT